MTTAEKKEEEEIARGLGFGVGGGGDKVVEDDEPEPEDNFDAALFASGDRHARYAGSCLVLHARVLRL
jgi:hypothetical protein